VYEYLPNTQPIFGRGAANTVNRDFDIVATIAANPVGVTEGVILAHGNRCGGYTLFIQDEKAHFVYNLCGVREYRVSTPFTSVNGITQISVIYTKTDGQSQGRVDLIVGNGEPVTDVIVETISTVFPLHSSLDCGLDRGLSVCADYESPFAFTGQIESVKVSIGEQRPVDYSKIIKASFSEQ
jgi:arylsulfatase